MSKNFSKQEINEIEVERFCDEEIPVPINITPIINLSPSRIPFNRTEVGQVDKIEQIKTKKSLKTARKSRPRNDNTLEKFVGKKKKYKTMTKNEILKDYYLNHCGKCKIRFNQLDQDRNEKIGMI